MNTTIKHNSRHTMLGALCVLLLSTAGADARPNLSSPQATVRSFVAALNKYDFKQAALCVAGARPSTALSGLEQSLKRDKVTFSISNLTVKTSGNNATAALRVRMNTRWPAKNNPNEPSRLRLHREKTGWKIVSGDRSVLAAPERAGVLQALATFIAHPQAFGRARGTARATSCQSNMKQAALAMMQFLQDNDEKYALKASSFKKSLMPYIKSEMIFRCPDDKSGAVSYSFNRNLENVSQTRLARVSETVMLYEGKNGRLDFRHNGRANVAFADGHVKLINQQQAKTLRWKP